MPEVARVNTDSAGGLITGNLAPTVFVNSSPIAVKGAAVSGHGGGPHGGPVLDGSSTNVYANGILICREGDLATCGDPISSGSPSVYSGVPPTFNPNLLGVSSLGGNSLG